MTYRTSLIVAPLALAMTTALPSYGQDKVKDDQVESSVSNPIAYFLGISIGQQMRQNGFRLDDLDMDVLLSGFNDGMSEQESALTDKELAATQQKIETLLQERRKQQLVEAKKKGDDFLAANAKKKGVKQLKNGVQYKVLEEGDGASPERTDTVKVHYTGKLINGTMFDSSVKRGEPAVFRVSQVINGWQIALQEMKVGDKWMIYIPSEQAYGVQGSQGAIGPNEALIFEVELLEIQ